MTNDATPSYVAIGADELGEYLGKTIRCTRCGGTHAIEDSAPSTIHHPDGTTSEGPAGTLQFYRCGDDLFLAGVEGRALAP